MNDPDRNTDRSQDSGLTENQLQADKRGEAPRDPMDFLPDELENPDVYRAIKSAPPFHIPRRKSDRK